MPPFWVFTQIDGVAQNKKVIYISSVQFTTIKPLFKLTSDYFFEVDFHIYERLRVQIRHERKFRMSEMWLVDYQK